MTSPEFTVDHAASQRRRDDIARYFAQNVWSDQGEFLCRSKAMCRASALKNKDNSFYGGQGQAVGSSYEVRENGPPIRVLVIPMETAIPQEGMAMTPAVSLAS